LKNSRPSTGQGRSRAARAARDTTVALLHYSCPPVIGGVEFVVEAHAAMFVEAGCSVRVIAGKGGEVHPQVRTVIVPEAASDGGPLRATVDALNEGGVPAGFESAVRRIEQALKPALHGVDVCLIHNVMTMHFNLVLTAALARFMERGGGPRFVAWCHDSTFADKNYRRHQRDEYPWSLLKQRLPGCDYAVISEQRRKEFRRLFGVARSELPVFPDGVDVASLLGLTSQVFEFYRAERLFEKDIVAVTPARIVRRKNLEAGLKIVAAFKAQGKSVRWMITGAPDPHNADSVRYYAELLALRQNLGLEAEVVFLCERFEKSIRRASLRALMVVSDVLLFPSSKEGFGIPVLEAGMADLVLALGDIPALREIAGPEAVYIPERFRARTIANQIWKAFRNSPRLQFRKRIVREYSWSAVFSQKVLPAVLDPDAVWPNSDQARAR